MYTRQTTYEEVMTLEEARKIIKAERQEKREEIVELAEAIGLILSILVDTFISKISFPMQPGPEIGSISDA